MSQCFARALWNTENSLADRLWDSRGRDRWPWTRTIRRDPHRPGSHANIVEGRGAASVPKLLHRVGQEPYANGRLARFACGPRNAGPMRSVVAMLRCNDRPVCCLCLFVASWPSRDGLVTETPGEAESSLRREAERHFGAITNTNGASLLLAAHCAEMLASSREPVRSTARGGSSDWKRGVQGSLSPPRR